MIMLWVSSPFSCFISWKRRQFLQEYCTCWSTCTCIFLKSSWRSDAWRHKLLIISSLNFLLASNSRNFSKRKLNVSAKSVSYFSPLIWFSFKVFVFTNILFTLNSNFLKQSKRILLPLEESKPFFKNIVVSVTSAWCYFFGFLSICIFLGIITETALFLTRKVFSNIHHQIIFLLYFVK